jgi:hypothetical protein
MGVFEQMGVYPKDSVLAEAAVESESTWGRFLEAAPLTPTEVTERHQVEEAVVEVASLSTTEMPRRLILPI